MLYIILYWIIMKKTTIYLQRFTFSNHILLGLSFIIYLMCALSCETHPTASPSAYASGDSLIQHISQIYLTQPTEALALLDSAERNDLLKPNDINGMRAVIYCNAFRQTHVPLAYSKRIYESPEAQQDTTILIKTLKLLTGLNYQNGNYGEAIHYAQKGSELAHAMNDQEGDAYFLQHVGFAIAEMHQIDEAIDYVDRSIALYEQIAKQEETWKTDDNIFFGWLQKINILISAERYEEAISFFPDCEAALKRLSEVKDFPAGMLDIRTAQFCSLCMFCLIHNHELDQAKLYYERFCTTTTSSNPAEMHLAVPYLIATHQYQAATDNLQRVRRHFEETRDTISNTYIDNILLPMLQIQQETGRTADALQTAHQIIALKDSIFQHDKQQQTVEMAAIYETEDKAHQIEYQKQKLQHGRIMLSLTLLLLLVACVVIVLIVRYNLLIRKKNRTAVATIHELMAAKSKLAERTKPTPQQSSDSSPQADETMQRLMRQIEEEELFRDANFSRNEALALVPGLSMKNFSLQFNKCTGCSFPRYLNNLRLEYSLGLLCSSTNYSIEGIALESGFSCRQTYHRLFVERFGLTPSEYKNAEQETLKSDISLSD